MSRQSVESSSSNEQAMHGAFEEQTREILQNPERFAKDGSSVKFGVEVEYGLIHPNLDQPSEEIRNSIIQDTEGFTDIELGAAQIEMRTDPIDISSGFGAVLEQLKVRDQLIADSAHDKGVDLISHGTNPFIPTREIVRSDQPKYRIVPNFHNDNQRPDLATHLGDESVDVGDAAIIGIANSVQANIEALSVEDAVDKVNRSFQIGPMVVALSGNARFLEGKDTGYQDVRMVGWEISHDTRTSEEVESGEITRVGLPRDYYSSLEDYFKAIAENPFILNAPQAAIFVGIGLNWRDARIKVIGDSLVVEFRPVSCQPTPEENFSTMVFYLGRLLWSQQNQEALLPMDAVVENREEAMKNGTDAQLWTNTDNGIEKLSVPEAMEHELYRAEMGLAEAGLLDNYAIEALQLLNARVTNGNPAEVLARLRERYIQDGEESLVALYNALAQLNGIR